MLASMVDQDVSHRDGRAPQEVPAVLPVLSARARESQVGLVEERRRLERVPGAFATHTNGGDPPEFLIELVEELVRVHLEAWAPRAGNPTMSTTQHRTARMRDIRCSHHDTI